MTMSMYELDGKVAIVTGCAREQGIGRATANRLAAEGCKVVLTDVGRRPDLNPDYVVGSLDELDEAAAEVSERGGTATAIVADVTDPASVQNLVDQSVEAFGGVAILVNVAGVGMGAPFLEMPLDVWNHVIAVNTTGPMLCAQAAAKQMVEQGRGGRIVTVASQASKIGGTNRPRPVDAPPATEEELLVGRGGGGGVYAVSKAAAMMLTRMLAFELAPHQVTVNAVCPGFVDTQLLMGGFEMRAEEMGVSMEEWLPNFVKNTIPLGRMQTGDDVADLIAFLCSDQASYMTGQSINTTGGTELHSG